MSYLVITEDYEIRIYKSLKELSENILDVDPANFLTVNGHFADRTEVFSSAHFRRLMRGKVRAYISPAETGDWFYKILKI